MIELFSYIILSLIIVIVLFLINFLFSYKKSIFFKKSIYECGFENFSFLNESIDLKFFIIGILFLIFDIEIIFLFPISLNFFFLGFIGYWIVLFFIVILIIGFIFEWKKGSLILY